ncbi:MAG: stage IV sporulation protein A [Clostridia bacterium]|nr:stage IV sporulation protein A [Clostridia bacterium]
MTHTSIYQDIATRTDGNIYIGVVGPVRTGKSTFIKSFMEQMVLPNIDNIYLKERAKDELPQSGSGRTIMTAEPKFIPEEAVSITVDGGAACNLRLIDCVGYMVEGAIGQFEEDQPRMVHTPWFEKEIPLAQAAEIGTRKVITEHSTIGVVVTTDGSIGDIPREAYAEAEERIVRELQEIHKPFCLLLNTTEPQSERASALRKELEKKYGVTCLSVNCLTLRKDEIDEILSAVLYEFPVKEFRFTLPQWITMLQAENTLQESIYQSVFSACESVRRMRDARKEIAALSGRGEIEQAILNQLNPSDGTVTATIVVPQALYYQMLSEQCGIEIRSEADLVPLLCDMARIRKEYEHVAAALEQVRRTGYGIVMPDSSEMHLEQPEIVKQGGRFGVKLKASAPSIHLIQTQVETEISPIVGSEKQSEDLVNYLMQEFEDSPEKLWESNIFGKSLSELVNEGLNNKLYKMPDDARGKLQTTLERIINEGSGGLICIIL